jgi:diguanylate cyclase (GGDEF)-like protein/PAS domain S-box-containing protein
LENVTGWRPDQLVGKSFLEFIHPDDRTSIMNSQPTLAHGDSASFEARLRLANGRYRWFASRVQPIIGDNGTIVGRVAAWRDIEGEHVAREALLASEAQYRRLADNATDLVYQSGADRLISWISPSVEATLGWAPEELLGTLMANLMHPEDRIRFEDVREQAYAGEVLDTSLLPAAWRFHAKDGHYVWMTVRTTSIFDDDGAPAGTINGMSAVDDLVRAQETCANEAARRQAIVESLIDPHVLLQAVRDAGGAIVDFVYADANEAACEYNRTPREQLVGMRLLDLLPGQAGSGMLGLYADAVESGRPLELNDYAYPHEVLHQERRFDIRASRVGDALSFTWRDVTDRFTVAREMAESEERYRLLAENSSDVVLHSREGIIVWISPSVADVLGGTPEDWVGLRLPDLIHPDDLAAYATVQTAIEAGRRPTKRARVRAFDGSYHWIEAHARLYLDGAGMPDGHIASLRIVDELVHAEAELAYQAHFDALTGLAKREEALSRLSDAGRNRRSPGGECAVLFCDVDDFKSVNDAWGHVAGDEVLRTVAERILRSVRGGDTVARMGGDEFLVIADGVHDLDEACAIAEKMRSAASVPLALNGGGVRTTLSIGVTLSLRHEPVDTVVSRADHAMYEAKHRGRNQVVAVPAPAPAEASE